MIKWLEKLQNFRLLPVFVLVSMAVGIAIGKVYSISNFALTPPIDAIKATVRGEYSFTLPNTLALGVVVGLFLGTAEFDVWVVAESVVLYLGVPLMAGVMTRRCGMRSTASRGSAK